MSALLFLAVQRNAAPRSIGGNAEADPTRIPAVE